MTAFQNIKLQPTLLKLVCIIGLLAANLSLSAQHKSSLYRVDSLYKTAPFMVSWVKCYYQKMGDKKPVKVDSGSMAKHGADYCWSQGKQLNIVSNGLVLHVDHQNKKITLDSAKQGDYVLPNKRLMGISNFFALMDSVKIDSTTTRYIIPSVVSAVSYTHVDLDPARGNLKRVTHFSAEHDTYRKEDTRYYSSVIGVAPDQSLFSMDTYLSKRWGKYRLTNDYQQYSLINNLP